MKIAVAWLPIVRYDTGKHLFGDLDNRCKLMHYSSILETANHFRCIDILIDRANGSLSENLIKELHLVLKNGTSDSSGSIHFRMEMAGSVA